ncbi:MAG: hypothetical protein LBS65_05065, partial [Desulfovibrio sp.]|nr:hypothetical protein [Desulfovibrio sp.]
GAICSTRFSTPITIHADKPFVEYLKVRDLAFIGLTGSDNAPQFFLKDMAGFVDQCGEIGVFAEDYAILIGPKFHIAATSRARGVHPILVKRGIFMPELDKIGFGMYGVSC